MNEMTNSHLLVQEFEYEEPTSIADVIALLTKYGDKAQVLAGGTDLLVQMKMERVSPHYLVSLSNVPELDQIVAREDGLHIGARTSIRAVRFAPEVQIHYQTLAEACASFSTTQIQFMGTIGGNLCNASPASDTAPALIVLSAQLWLVGPKGERQVPVEKFFSGPGKSVLQKGEVIVSIHLPPSRPRTGSAFLKMSRVAADIAKASAAVLLERNGECIISCRLAFGSVSPIPLRAHRAEALLTGQVFHHDLVMQAAQVASEEISPIDDVRSTASYRREIVKVMTHDGLYRAFDRAGGTEDSKVREQKSGGWIEKSDGKAHSGGSGIELHEVKPLARPIRLESQPPLREIDLTVNGIKYRLSVATNDLLLNVLRDNFELTGTKYGCGIGECSACTIQMNGKPVLSCLVLAISANGSEIVTVEGLQNSAGDLDPLQDSFIEYAAAQCGYCTPGMLMTAKSLLNENPTPTEDEVRDYLKGNLCRCTGYASIVRAVLNCREKLTSPMPQ
jgi:xanthine dehydrogenase iron-sulfur cluster and FAD-binding subunit A